MGTRKGSKAKLASSAAAIKHKSTSNAKKANLVSLPTKPQRRPAVTTGWEEWEDGVVIALRKEGTSDKQISQHLPGRTERACQNRWYYKLKAESHSVGSSTQQKDVLASTARRRKHWQKKWEDWEDQMLVTHHKAGENWESISRMLPPRTAYSVKNRWTQGKLFLDPRTQDAVATQTQSSETPSVPRAVKTYNHWEKEEEQLLKSLRESGKSWADIATRLPNRSAKGCRTRWCGTLHKRQGPKSAAKSGLQWEEWEERLLVSGYYAGLSWKEINEPITGRTVHGCKNQWTAHFDSPDQDEPWTSEELARLAYLRREGSGWDKVSQELPGHTSNACRTQWYKEAEGIQDPSNHQGVNDTWSAEEVEVLVALYNTIGPRWQEICKHIPGRTEEACRTWLKTRCTKADGVGGPPSEFWEDFFMSKLGPRNLCWPR